MNLPGILQFTITVLLCILIVAFIPALMAVRRAAASLTSLSDMVHKELKPAINELTSVLTELKFVGSDVAEHSRDIKRFLTALGETGDHLHTINRSVGVVAGTLGTASAWAVGAKVAGRYVIERYLKKRGGR